MPLADLETSEVAEWTPTVDALESRALRVAGYCAASLISLAVFVWLLSWILSSNTAQVYGFPVSTDLRTLIEISLQIAPMIAAFFMVLLLPVKHRVIEHFVKGDGQRGRRIAITVAASAGIALIAVASVAIAIFSVAGFQTGGLSAATLLWVAGELAYDLTLIGIFTTTLYALKRRVWLTFVLFIGYALAVINVGPLWGITSYIGFGSSVPVMLTSYSTAPLYDSAGWLFRVYWSCVTLLMLAVLYAFDHPARSLTANIVDHVRGREERPRANWYPIPALLAICVLMVIALTRLQGEGVAKYQAPSEAALKAAAQGIPPTARLRLTHFDVRLGYRPAEVAVKGSLTFRNGDQPLRTAHFQMPALMVPERLQIQGSGDYSTVRLGKYLQVNLAKELAPRQEIRVSYDGLIRPAGSFDLAVQAKVLDGAFFLADADVLITARSAACLGASPACGDAENYLMSDHATGRITVVTPEQLLVASPGEGSRRSIEAGQIEHTFQIATPRLATFMVAGAPFRESVAASANGVRIRVLRSKTTVADGDLEAPLAEKILSFYQSFWPEYPRRELTIVETPTPFGEALALEGTVAISDKIIASRSPISGSASNLLEFVMAHEIAHQWWGFGVVPARAPGRLFLIESIPQFAAYKFLGSRGILGEETARRNEEVRYQAARRRLGDRETTLARTENVDEIAYNKGPFVLLSLDQNLGGAMMDRLGTLFGSYSHETRGRISPDQFVADLIADLPEENREIARSYFHQTGSGPAQGEPTR